MKVYARVYGGDEFDAPAFLEADIQESDLERIRGFASLAQAKDLQHVAARPWFPVIWEGERDNDFPHNHREVAHLKIRGVALHIWPDGDFEIAAHDVYSGRLFHSQTMAPKDFEEHTGPVLWVDIDEDEVREYWPHLDRRTP